MSDHVLWDYCVIRRCGGQRLATSLSELNLGIMKPVPSSGFSLLRFLLDYSSVVLAAISEGALMRNRTCYVFQYHLHFPTHAAHMVMCREAGRKH